MSWKLYTLYGDGVSGSCLVHVDVDCLCGGTTTVSSPPLSPTLQSAPQAIAAHLVPLDLLPRHGQLSPQPLETRLAHRHERPVQLFLIRPLHACDLPHYLRPGIPDILNTNWFIGLQLYIPVLVVMHMEINRAGDRAGGEGEVVGAAPAARPEVGGGVFVGDEEDGEVGGGVGGGG